MDGFDRVQLRKRASTGHNSQHRMNCGAHKISNRSWFRALQRVQQALPVAILLFFSNSIVSGLKCSFEVLVSFWDIFGIFWVFCFSILGFSFVTLFICLFSLFGDSFHWLNNQRLFYPKFREIWMPNSQQLCAIQQVLEDYLAVVVRDSTPCD